MGDRVEGVVSPRGHWWLDERFRFMGDRELRLLAEAVRDEARARYERARRVLGMEGFGDGGGGDGEECWDDGA